MPIAVTVTRMARRILDILLIVLIGLVLATLVIAHVIPVVTGGATFVVGGGSMEPTIPVGAAIVALPVSAEELVVGDIVSLRAGEQRAIFTHRITRVVYRDGHPWLETMGDANEDPDPSLVPATSVIGRVEIMVPWAGYLVTILGSIQGIVFLVSLGVLVLAGAWLLEMLEDDLAESLRRRPRAGLAPLTPEAANGRGVAG